MSVATGIGLASGLDFNSILAQMRQVNSRPIQLVSNQISRLENQRAAVQEVNRAVLDFQGALEALNSRESFLNLSADSSDSNVVGATVTGEAARGGFSVRVLQLAKAHRLGSQGVATASETAIASGTGTLQLQVGQNPAVSVEVTAGMTLNQLRDAINNLDGAKLRASIVNDGTATNPNRLVLTALESGADNPIQIVNNDTTLNFSTTTIEAAAAPDANQFDGTITSSGTYTGATTRNVVMEITTAGAVGAAKYRVSLDGGLTFGAANAFTTSAGAVDVTGASGEGILAQFAAGTQNFAVGDRFTIDAFAPELQQAQNALIEVDGVQISRAANEFENVIEGITLTAKKVDAEAQTITVSSSIGVLQGNITSFVQAYNKLVDTATQATAYNAETQQAAPLFGDAAVNSLLAALRSKVTGPIPGLNTDLNSLSRIGISVNKEGKLDLDTAKLRTSLDENLDAVTDLFVTNGRSASSEVKFISASRDVKIGGYAVNVTTAGSQASYTGAQTIGPGGLAQDELLTIQIDGKVIAETLNAGSNLTQIINQLNTRFGNEAVGLKAIDDNGQLRVRSEDYGASEKFTIRSNRDAATVNQLGIGTTDQAAAGADVAGTINGFAATGKGQILETTDGLKLLITATGAIVATVSISKGVAGESLDVIGTATDTENGLFNTRNDALNRTIETLNKRIEDLTSRLDADQDLQRKKFIALEQQLASLKNQENFLLGQLASLIGG